MSRARLIVVALLLFPGSALAQFPLMIPDSGTGDRIMLFDGFNGSLIDANWITDTAQPFVFTTPKEAAVVGNEIWVSDQVADAVHRFDLSRNFLGSITNDASGNTLDNLRGFGYDGTTVYLTRFHGTATLRGVVTINAATATPTGFFAIGTNSVFDAQPFQSDLLISNSTTNNIERWTPAGAFVNNFATTITFPQQVAQMTDGSIITVSTIATAGIEGVYHFNTDATLRRFIDTEPLKLAFGEQVPTGAWQLGDGNYLISTGIGIFKYDVAGNSFSQMLGGVGGQYINPFIPEPSCLSFLALSGLLALRRR
jgi:hypothetical protein